MQIINKCSDEMVGGSSVVVMTSSADGRSPEQPQYQHVIVNPTELVPVLPVQPKTIGSPNPPSVVCE